MQVTSKLMFISTYQQGTIASMFNVDTKSGRLYVFDIERTCGEVLDHARRVLHSRGIQIFAGMPKLGTEKSEIDGKAKDAEVSEQFVKVFTCPICADHAMDSAFVPCGHLSCESCASRYVSFITLTLIECCHFLMAWCLYGRLNL